MTDSKFASLLVHTIKTSPGYTRKTVGVLIEVHLRYAPDPLETAAMLSENTLGLAYDGTCQRSSKGEQVSPIIAILVCRIAIA